MFLGYLPPTLISMCRFSDVLHCNIKPNESMGYKRYRIYCLLCIEGREGKGREGEGRGQKFYEVMVDMQDTLGKG